MVLQWTTSGVLRASHSNKATTAENYRKFIYSKEILRKNEILSIYKGVK